MDEVFETDSGVDVTARQQSVDHIMKILRELTPEEAYIFDRADAVSDISELSDPFVEMAEHRPKPKPKVEEKKNEKGMTFKQTLSGYPPEVSKLYEDVYQILKENPTAKIKEPEDDIPFEGFTTNPEFVKKCQSIADAVSFKNYLAERKKEEDRARKSRRSGRGSPPTEFEIENTSFPSMWRMIEAEAQKGVFEITQPGYNRYERVSLDWITRDQMEKDTTDFSREKCERWLKIKKANQ